LEFVKYTLTFILNDKYVFCEIFWNDVKRFYQTAWAIGTVLPAQLSFWHWADGHTLAIDASSVLHWADG